ncbi:MAG: adenylate/guanylate cyclase domain-containing protein [Alphaproteobacteria bacterium]|nr:adenylate/guanylate cyclase domain-containing protein [Alphaproteobacteria bacterium]
MMRLKRSLHLLVPLVMLALALVGRTSVPAFEEAQLKVFDVFQRLHPRAYEAAPVKIIDLDDETLSRKGQWPWPRTYMADLLARLFNAGAAAVVFDVVFAEPDRTSPKQILPLWPEIPATEALRQATDQLPDHDAVFAEVIAQVPVVTGFVLTDGEIGQAPELKGSFAFAGDDPLAYLPRYSGTVTSLPALEAAATGNGSFNLIPEADGIIRRVPLLVRRNEQMYPSLALEALRVVQGARTFVIKSSGANQEAAFGAHTGINHIKVGRIEVPTDSFGRLWVHFTEYRPERYIPAWQVFADDFDPALVEGQILLLGTSAAGLKDLRSTPLNPASSGVEVHAQAIEQMLIEYYIERPDWADGAEIVYLLVLGGGLILLLRRFGALTCALLGAGGIGTAIAASWYSFTELRWLLDPVFPSLAVLLIYLAGSLINYLRSEAERRQVRGAFSRYMSPDLVKQLAADPSKLVLGGEMRTMTLLFSDIRGFTTISEMFKGDPKGLTGLINRFLTPMTDMILSQRGTIDKYMGDAIMAFWNAPLDDPDHARNGCRAALNMFGALESLNATIKAEREAAGLSYYPLNIGIGLNTGECCVGNMGSNQRFDYSVLGDPVNLASRLEGQSKNYGVGIVIGEETFKRVPELAAIELDLIAVKGKREGVHIFALLGDEQMRASNRFTVLAARHGDMLAAYRGREFAKARELVKECRALDGTLTTLYDLYDERVETYLADPPPPDWDGVFVATSK